MRFFFTSWSFILRILLFTDFGSICLVLIAVEAKEEDQVDIYNQYLCDFSGCFVFKRFIFLNWLL